MDTSCRERSWHLCISHYWTDQISQGFIYLVRTQNFLKSFHFWHLDSLLSIYYAPFITPVCVLGVNKFYFFGIFYVPTKWMILNRISYSIFPFYSVHETMNLPEQLTHIMSLASFYTSWKYQKTSGFLMFSGGIKREQWHEMS